MIDWLLKRSAYLKQLETELRNNSLKIATLEGAYLVKYESQKPQGSVRSNFDTKLMRNIRKSKKALVMAQIIKSIDFVTTTELYESIVLEQHLCSKASFYRYLDSIRFVSRLQTETKKNKQTI